MADRTTFAQALAVVALGALMSAAPVAPNIASLSLPGANASELSIGGRGSGGGLDASVDATAPVGLSALDPWEASSRSSTDLAGEPAHAADPNSLASAAATLGATPTAAVLSTLAAYRDAVARGSIDAEGLLAVVAAKPVTAAVVGQVNAQLGAAAEPTTTAELLGDFDPDLSAEVSQ